MRLLSRFSSSMRLFFLTAVLALSLALIFPAPDALQVMAAQNTGTAQGEAGAKAQVLYRKGKLRLIRRADGIYCKIDGKKVKNAWKTIDGNTYYFGSTGAASTGTVKIGNKYYCFDKMGRRRSGFIKNKKGIRYYSKSVGYRLTGWRNLYGNRYYFDENGYAATGLKKIDGQTYRFSAKGVLYMKGWQTSKSGKTRYFSKKDGHMYTGIRTVAGTKYGFAQNGVLVREGRLSYAYFNRRGVLREKKSRTLAQLKSQLAGRIRSFPGTWSVYVSNMTTGHSFSINNRPMYAASLIKLFAMGAAYQRVADGTMSEGAVSGLIPTMIADSNNSAFNSVIHTIGPYTVNRWCRAHGYTQTSQVHGLSPAYNNSGLRTSGGSNVTSVEDCGKFLESVYLGTCVNEKYSAKMVNALKLITRDKSLYYRSKLPSGVPGSALCANKTGDVDDYTHDCAIVYSKNADYVICVMAHVPGRGYSCSSYFRAISSMVYNFFNS